MDGEPFKCFVAQRAEWAKYDLYRSPGPLQYFSTAATVELCITLTLELNHGVDPRMSMTDIQTAIACQNKGKRFGQFHHAPAVGNGADFLSACQKLRALYRPPLCNALNESTQTSGSLLR